MSAGHKPHASRPPKKEGVPDNPVRDRFPTPLDKGELHIRAGAVSVEDWFPRVPIGLRERHQRTPLMAGRLDLAGIGVSRGWVRR